MNKTVEAIEDFVGSKIADIITSMKYKQRFYIIHKYLQLTKQEKVTREETKQIIPERYTQVTDELQLNYNPNTTQNIEKKNYKSKEIYNIDDQIKSKTTFLRSILRSSLCEIQIIV